MYIILTKDLHPTITTNSGLSLSCNHTNTDVRMRWASMWTFLFREYAEKHQLQIDVSKSYVRLADSKKNLTTKKNEGV